MARIGIYNEPFAAGLGGSEYLIAVLAEAFGRLHQVEIVSHSPSLSIKQLTEFSGRDLSGVSARYVPFQAHDFGTSHNPWRRYQGARQWQRTLSEPYDLFIASMHHMPPFCHASKGVLLVLFPSYPAYAHHEDPGVAEDSLWRSIARRYHKWEWKKRMDSYQVKTAISQFSSTWARRLWGIDCHVIYPPAGVPVRHDCKANMILSVGRFAIEGEGHGKKQLEMLEAFCRVSNAALKDWEYFSVGNLLNSSKHHAFFEKLIKVAMQCHAQVLADLNRNEVQNLFDRARIFWHAAGYGEDEEVHPERCEHFGIVTVEAMAAGCVPVVINKGGQKEIVEHGVNGFLWDTFEELLDYTARLARDEALRERMSKAARARARQFSVEAFQGNFRSLLDPLISAREQRGHVQ